MKYAYARVSSTTQNLDRQVDEFFKLGINNSNIYTDVQSGSDFKRDQYQKLKKKLRQNDLLIIKSIDRLGRDYQMIIDEWHYITKVIKADIKVIDMPLLDTSSTQSGLIGQFISDIVLQILSFVSQNEKENIRQRQAEGIRLAKAKGKHLGRPPISLPGNFDNIAHQYISGLISLNAAISSVSLSRPTFLKYLKARLL